MSDDVRRILVVDDETIIANFLQNLLSARNSQFAIETASTGDDAVRKANELRPHVVVLDINIPGKNGFEVCRAIRKDVQCRHSVILAMTSDPDPQRVARIVEEGAAECLRKPFALRDFLQKVQTYSDQACQREEEAGQAKESPHANGIS